MIDKSRLEKMTTEELKEMRKINKELWDAYLTYDYKGWKTEWNKKINECRKNIKRITKLIEKRA